MLHLAQPLDTSDPLLLTDEERRALLTRVPRPDLDPFWMHAGETPAWKRFAPDVRAAARQRTSDTEDAA